MWVVDLTVVREGVPRSKSCGFHTKYALIEFMGKLIQRDNIVTVNIYYDEGLGKRGDNQ